MHATRVSTFAQCVGTFPSLVSRLDSKRVIDRWAAIEPALAGAATVSRLRDWTAPGGDPTRARQVFAALVRLSSVDQGDGFEPEPDAVLVAIHLLRPAITRRAIASGPESDETMRVLISELALVIQTFPWRRVDPAPGRLVLDAWNQAWRGQVRRDAQFRQKVTVTDDPDRLADACSADRGLGVELVDVLTEAAREEVLTGAQVDLVWQMIRAGGYATTGATNRVAEQLGVDVSTVRRRYQRIVAALATYHRENPGC